MNFHTTNVGGGDRRIPPPYGGGDVGQDVGQNSGGNGSRQASLQGSGQFEKCAQFLYENPAFLNAWNQDSNWRQYADRGADYNVPSFSGQEQQGYPTLAQSRGMGKKKQQSRQGKQFSSSSNNGFGGQQAQQGNRGNWQ